MGISTHMNVGRAFGMVKETFAAWNADKAPRLAAAISYTAIFAIAPLMIITIAIAGAVLGFAGTAHPHSSIESLLVERIGRAAGGTAGDLVRGMVDAAFGRPRQNVLAQIVGWVTFVAGASSAFAALQDALNTIWDAHPQHGSLWQLVRDRVMSGVMILAIGFLLLLSFGINVAISFASGYLAKSVPLAGNATLLALANWIVSVAVIALLFALIFRVLPDVEIRWRDVALGAIVTAVLFVVGQGVIGFYIGRAAVASAYGAAGALLAVLVWIYYSAAILLLGAEFTKVCARHNADKVNETTPLHAA